MLQTYHKSTYARLLLIIKRFTSFSYKISLIKCMIVIKKYLDYKFSSNQNQLKDKSDVHHFKLLNICNISFHIKT